MWRTKGTDKLPTSNLSGALGVGGASAQGAACWRFAAAAGQGVLYGLRSELRIERW